MGERRQHRQTAKSKERVRRSDPPAPSSRHWLLGVSALVIVAGLASLFMGRRSATDDVRIQREAFGRKSSEARSKTSETPQPRATKSAAIGAEQTARWSNIDNPLNDGLGH